jgi:peptidoglycan hydrolase-like protein with peptidoglycan-binding domain
MRALSLAVLLAASVAPFPAFAEPRAVVAASMPERGARPDRAPDAQGTVAALGRAGFATAGGQDLSAAQIQAFLADLHPPGDAADKAVIVLAGSFVHSPRTTWFLGADAARARGVDLGSLAGDAIDVALVLDLAALAPQGAVVVLAEASGGPVAGSGLTAGIGPLGPLPPGVTVISGPAAEAMAFARDDLLLRGVPLRSLVARRGDLRAEGLPGRAVTFLPPEDGRSPEDRAWAAAQRADTAEGYLAYLAAAPDGVHAAEARAALDRLGYDPVEGARRAEEALGLTRDQRRAVQRDLTTVGFNTRGIDGIFGPGTRSAIGQWQRRAGLRETGFLTAAQIEDLRRDAAAVTAERERGDRDYWRQTGARGDAAGLRDYLARYPQGVHAAEARRQLAAQDAQRERDAWDRARNVNTATGYRTYLDAFPNGANAAEARRRLQQADQGGSDRQAWNLALGLATLFAFQQYLDAFPNGRYADEARDRIDAMQGGADRDAWDRARRRDDIRAYRRYIDEFPRGRYVGEAEARIAELRNPGATADERAWQGATDRNTVAAYERYLREFPRGRHAQEARARIDQASGAAVDDRTWADARAIDTQQAYRGYIDRFPQGRHLGEARQRISQLDAADADARAWDRARSRDTVPDYRRYLAEFPQGAHRREAERRLAQLQQGSGGGGGGGGSGATGTEADWAQREAQVLGANTQLALRMEQGLAEIGFNPGTIDGRIDARTRAAIRAAQSASGAPVTGYADPALLTLLGLYERDR